jgi:lysozyme
MSCRLSCLRTLYLAGGARFLPARGGRDVRDADVVGRVCFAMIAVAMAASACSARTSEAGEAPAIVAAPALAPDVEAESIPSANGLPLVPLTAPVNFLDALEPRPLYRMPAEYNTNHTAVQIIKEEETLQLIAYELGGYWQIGYGHLMLEGEKDVITAEEAEAFLVKDLSWCEGAIERYVSIPVTLNEFSAMVALCYNIGSGKIRGSSIIKKINIDDRPGAANAFLLWNRMNGVVMQALAKRRARERTLFLTP